MRHTTESFIAAARAVHGGAYDYSGFEYPGGNKTVATFLCPTHGAWLQRPNDHLSGYGCPACGNAKIRRPTYSWAQFITDARRVHGDRYEYDERELLYMQDKVTIHCRIHGAFQQKGHQHHIARQQGCRRCCFTERDTTNYVSWKRPLWIDRWAGRAASFYILRCTDCDEDFIKVGITGTSVDERFRKTSKRIPYQWRLVRELKGDPGLVYDLEKAAQRALAPHRYTPRQRFVGHTECFEARAVNEALRLADRFAAGAAR